MIGLIGTWEGREGGTRGDIRFSFRFWSGAICAADFPKNRSRLKVAELLHVPRNTWLCNIMVAGFGFAARGIKKRHLHN